MEDNKKAVIYADVYDTHGRDVQVCPIIWTSDPDSKGDVSYDVEFKYRIEDGSTYTTTIRVGPKQFGGRSARIDEDIALTWFHTKDELERFMTHCGNEYVTLLSKHMIRAATDYNDGKAAPGFTTMKIRYYKYNIAEMEHLLLKIKTL